jgi:hypothetical protein
MEFMRLVFALAIHFLLCFHLSAQQPQDAQYNNLISNIIEDFLETVEAEDFDFNTILENLNYFYEHPMDINSVTEAELRELIILNEIQIGNFINYRNTFGDFLSIYELQAVPSWDMITIRNVLPFLRHGSTGIGFYLNFKDALKNGNSFLFLKPKESWKKGRDIDRMLKVLHLMRGTPIIGMPGTDMSSDNCSELV